MKLQLDQFDIRILEELRRNSRISHSDLAKKIHLSRNAVRSRIERLESNGYIAGYTIRQGAQNPHTSLLVALIFIYRHDRMRGGDVLAFIKRLPEVVYCDVMSGEFDIVLRVEAASADRIRSIWHDISELPGVRDTLTSFALNTICEPRLNSL